MLISTGKNPDIVSRKVARAFSLACPHSIFMGRGRRNLHSLLAAARRLHFTRLCIVGRADCGLHAIRFLEVLPRGFRQLYPEIKIDSASFHGAGKRLAQSTSLKIAGTASKALQGLLPPQPPAKHACSRIAASSRRVSLHLSNIKLLSLGVSYEGQSG